MRGMRSAEDRVYLRMTPEDKQAWEAACDEARTDQQTAGRALVRLFVQADPLVRAVLLGSVPMDAQVERLFIERLRGGKGKRRG
jgi:hypothetical protein